MQTETMEFMGRKYEKDSEHLGYRAAEDRRLELGAKQAAIDNKKKGVWQVWQEVKS